MKKQLASLVVLVLLAFTALWGCGTGGGSWIPSNLFAVVVGVDAGYTSANVSTVDLKSGDFTVSSSILSGFCGDTIAKTRGNYVLLIERPSWGTVPSPVHLYEAGSWETPLKEYNLGKNVHDVVFLNDEVAYAIQWGESYVEKFNPLTGDDLGEIDLSSYDTDGIPDMDKGAYVNGKLFVTLQRMDSETYSYDMGMVVAIDTNSDQVSCSIELSGKNPQDIDYYAGKLYVTELGNYFDASDDVIDVIDVNSAEVNELISAPLENEGMDIYAIEIISDGKGYLLGGKWETSAVFKVYKLNLETGEVDPDPIYSGGYITSIKYDPVSGYLLILDRGTGAGDGGLVIYDPASESIVDQIPEENLGYPPYSADISAFD
ncbi:MAG: hypothetical protein J7M13_08730 [Synergistetes bacterium]|nr:hypothetical protein [Synergistota bacterium]